MQTQQHQLAGIVTVYFNALVTARGMLFCSKCDKNKYCIAEICGDDPGAVDILCTQCDMILANFNFNGGFKQ